MRSEVTRLKDIIKTKGPSSNVQAALGSFFEKLGDFDSAKHHLEKAVLLNSDNPGFLKFNTHLLNNSDPYFILYFRNFNDTNKPEFYFFVLLKILNTNGF